jgi:hypothetical protein
MRTILAALACLLLSCAGPASETVKTSTPASASPSPTAVPARIIKESFKIEKQADLAFNRLNRERNIEKAAADCAEAIELYRKAVDLYPANEKLAHKYTLSVDMLNNLLIPFGQKTAEKQKAYDSALALLERLYPGNDNSSYINYDIALMLIGAINYYNFIQAIAAVNRIKDYAEKIYKADHGFLDYDAEAVLGRIHYLAPNIPFILPWPDKNISRQYLEDAHVHNPGSLLIKLFLADTLYSLGEKETATALYREVRTAKAREDLNYFRDMKVHSDCERRMLELGIQ